MDFATVDLETFYHSKDGYTLSKMQTDAYVLDDRFQIIGVGVKPSRNAEIEWFTGTLEETRDFLINAFDWEHTPVVCHNTLFDGFIFTQRLGLKPKMWLDTLGMARAAFPWLKSHSLASVAEHLGIGQKGHEVLLADGKRREDFTPQELARYGEYCRNDVALTSVIAELLLDQTPKIEQIIIDMTIRMFTEPKLLGDVDRLQAYYEGEVRRKEELLAAAERDKTVLMSNDKLAEALRELGVEPPTKISPRTGKRAYAFSKTDKEFSALLDHEDSQVQTLVAARLGVKSTIAETRALRMIETAKRGPLPIYLNYWGAKVSGRLSGGNGNNYQNIPARGPSSEIRRCMVTPPGHTVVVGDSSNIELRVAMALAGHDEVLEKIASGVDLYCDFASKLFGREITKDDKKERMLGKIAMLSFQYGAGAAKFKEMVRVQAKMTISEDEAQRIVSLYRTVYGKIQKLWWHCGDEVLNAIHQGRVLTSVDVNGWFLTTHNGFALPGHPGVCYHDLKKDMDGQWSYQLGRERAKIYGGKLVENMSQHAARHIVMWQTARIHQRFPVTLTVHDEVVCVVPNHQVDQCVQFMTESLSLAPSWCRGKIPLACEVGTGPSYGEAK